MVTSMRLKHIAYASLRPPGADSYETQCVKPTTFIGATDLKLFSSLNWKLPTL